MFSPFMPVSPSRIILVGCQVLDLSLCRHTLFFLLFCIPSTLLLSLFSPLSPSSPPLLLSLLVEHLKPPTLPPHALPPSLLSFPPSPPLPLHSLPPSPRDIKSENILLSEDGLAKVSDFGLCKEAPIGVAEDGTAQLLPPATAVRGSFGYLDPEYLKTAVLTEKSDVYSYGVVLLELITGRYAVFEKQALTQWVSVRGCGQREGGRGGGGGGEGGGGGRVEVGMGIQIEGGGMGGGKEGWRGGNGG